MAVLIMKSCRPSPSIGRTTRTFSMCCMLHTSSCEPSPSSPISAGTWSPWRKHGCSIAGLQFLSPGRICWQHINWYWLRISNSTKETQFISKSVLELPPNTEFLYRSTGALVDQILASSLLCTSKTTLPLLLFAAWWCIGTDVNSVSKPSTWGSMAPVLYKRQPVFQFLSYPSK